MAVLLSGSDVAEITSSTGSWERIDLDTFYGSLPANTSGVILIFVNNIAANRVIGAREYNNTNFTITTDVGIGCRATCYVKCDTNHEIEVYREDSYVDCYLIGYFTTDGSWLSAPVDVTPGSTGWQPVLLSDYTSGGELFALFEVNAGTSRGVMFRYNGSSDDRIQGNSVGHHWAICPLDGSDYIETNVESYTQVTIYLVGFLSSGSIRTTGGSDLFGSLATGSYDQITLPDSGKEIAVLEISSPTAGIDFDLRATGDTNWPAALYQSERQNGNWTPVAIDGSNQADAKIATGEPECYCWGYLAAGGIEVTYATAVDGFDFGDENSKITTMQALAFEGLNLGEEPGKIAQMLATSIDGSDIGDQSLGILSVLRTSLDGLKIGDESVKILQAIGLASDGTQFSESVSKIAQLKPTAEDLFKLSESVSKIAQIVAIAEDGLKGSDELISYLQTSGIAIDGIELSELVDALVSIQTIASDGFKISDELQRIANLLANSADQMIFSESVSNILTAILTASDGTIVGDTNSAIGQFPKTSIDGIKLSDENEALISIQALVVDGLNFSDENLRRADFQSIAVDGLSLSESVSAIVSFIALAADGFKLSDETIGEILGAIEGIATDGFKISDETSPIINFISTAIDGFKIGDELLSFMQTIKSAIDGLKISDENVGTIISGIISALASDSFIGSDSAIPVLKFSVQATDGIQFSETLSTIMQILASAVDAFSIGDEPSYAVEVASGRVTVTFRMKRAGIVFEIKKPKITFH